MSKRIQDAFSHGRSEGFATGQDDYRFAPALIPDHKLTILSELRHAKEWVQVRKWEKAVGARVFHPAGAGKAPDTVEDAQAYRAYQVGFARGYREATTEAENGGKDGDGVS
jgi:hypothetical protein